MRNFIKIGPKTQLPQHQLEIQLSRFVVVWFSLWLSRNSKAKFDWYRGNNLASTAYSWFMLLFLIFFTKIKAFDLIKLFFLIAYLFKSTGMGRTATAESWTLGLERKMVFYCLSHEERSCVCHFSSRCCRSCVFGPILIKFRMRVPWHQGEPKISILWKSDE